MFKKLFGSFSKEQDLSKLLEWVNEYNRENIYKKHK